MSIVGSVESLWRYPVKSMRGEELAETFVGFGGLQGDRLFAFRSSLARADFPYFTGRQQPEMIRYRTRVREGNSSNDWMVDVETPAGKSFAIDDPALIEALRDGADPQHQLSLMRSKSALADAFPVSIFSLQTAAKLGDEIGTAVDQRRFRANMFVDLPGSAGFAEDEFVGHFLRIGRDAVVKIIKRDGRCMMINLHPDTALATPAILKTVAQAHEGHAGVYGAVVSEGTVRKGDPVELLAAWERE